MRKSTSLDSVPSGATRLRAPTSAEVPLCVRCGRCRNFRPVPYFCDGDTPARATIEKPWSARYVSRQACGKRLKPKLERNISISTKRCERRSWCGYGVRGNRHHEASAGSNFQVLGRDVIREPNSVRERSADSASNHGIHSVSATPTSPQSTSNSRDSRRSQTTEYHRGQWLAGPPGYASRAPCCLLARASNAPAAYRLQIARPTPCSRRSNAWPREMHAWPRS